MPENKSHDSSKERTTLYVPPVAEPLEAMPAPELPEPPSIARHVQPVRLKSRPSSPQASESRNQHHLRRLLLILCVVAVTVAGIVAYQIDTSSPRRLPDCRDLQSSLWQATPDQVQAKLGRPDAIADGSHDGSASWVYRNRTQDARTGQKDSEIYIHFERGRVSMIVCTPLRSIPRPAEVTSPQIED